MNRAYFHKKIISYSLLILVVAITVEGISYIFTGYLERKGIIYKPYMSDNYEEYLRKRDPLLGWPYPDTFGKGELDLSGSRIIPSFPDPESKTCISLYGDSFTFGSEVKSEFAWSNVLSNMLDCRVSNYGVEGYGTDRSYLRFKNNGRDRAEFVILGHLSENIVRNVNQLRGLIYHNEKFGLHPRFILGQNKSLEFIPLLQLSESEYREMINNPAKYLKYEYFLPGGHSGTYKASFPYTLSVIRSLNNYRIKSILAGKSFWADFYSEDHPSQALRLTTLIIESFYREAIEKGKIPVVVIFPMEFDLKVFKKTGKWDYQSLIDKLKEDEIETVNIGEGFIKKIGQRDPCSLFKRCDGGHYNEEGNRIVAELIRDYLITKKINAAFKKIN